MAARRIGPLYFDLFAQDRFVIFIQGEQPLRKKPADSPLHFRWLGVKKPAAKSIPRGLLLFRRKTVPQLMDKTPHANHENVDDEREDQWPKPFDEQRFHDEG